MVGHSGAGHLQHGGDVDHARLLMAQQPEDAHPVGVAELLEHIGHGGKVPRLAQLPAQRGGMALLPVIVGQFKVFRYNEQSDERKSELIELISNAIVRENFYKNDDAHRKFIKKHFIESWKRATEHSSI